MGVREERRRRILGRRESIVCALMARVTMSCVSFAKLQQLPEISELKIRRL